MLRYFILFAQIGFAVIIPFIILDEVQSKLFPGILELETAVIGGLIGVVLSLLVADRFVDRYERKQQTAG
jgi:hypothetical protein